MSDTPKVWIVLEGPDISHYGGAEIHGVYATEQEAQQRCAALNGGETNEWDSIQVESWEVGESSDREPPKPAPPARVGPLGVPIAGLLMQSMLVPHEIIMSSPQTTELSRGPWWHRWRLRK